MQIMDYIEDALEHFALEHTGKTIDLTGTYSGQSTDLAAEWMFRLTHVRVMPRWHAFELAGMSLPSMQWHEAGSAAPRKGDLLVWAETPGVTGPFGHAAIYLSGEGVFHVLDQSPTPVGTRSISSQGLLGFHRYAPAETS